MDEVDLSAELEGALHDEPVEEGKPVRASYSFHTTMACLSHMRECTGWLFLLVGLIPLLADDLLHRS